MTMLDGWGWQGWTVEGDEMGGLGMTKLEDWGMSMAIGAMRLDGLG